MTSGLLEQQSYFAVDGRPYMGQPLSDTLLVDEGQGAGIPVQRAVPQTAEEALPLSFNEYMHQQADALRRGEVTKETFEKFWEAVRPLYFCTYDIDETYVAPDGTPLLGVDADAADLLWRMRTPRAWTIDPVVADDLKLIVRSFAGLRDELDERIPLKILPGEEPRMVVGEIAAARMRLGEILGMNPYAFTLDELAQKATARLELSDAIADGAFAELFQSVVPAPRRAIAVVAMQNVVSPQGIVHSEPLSRGGSTSAASQDEEIPDADEPFVFTPAPQPASRRRRLEGFDNSVGDVLPGQRTIRSHERPSKHPGLVRRIAAAVALAAVVTTGLLLTKQEAAPHHPSTPAVVKLDPRPPVLTPPVVQTPPVEAQPPADRIIPLGDYNEETGAGTIWFSVEDYAKQLGYEHLTLLQTHMLTDQCIQYMDTRVPGGMSWDQATRLQPNVQLPYPPANTMRSMINDVLAQTTQGSATDFSDIT